MTLGLKTPQAPGTCKFLFFIFKFCYNLHYYPYSYYLHDNERDNDADNNNNSRGDSSTSSRARDASVSSPTQKMGRRMRRSTREVNLETRRAPAFVCFLSFSFFVIFYYNY